MIISGGEIRFEWMPMMCQKLDVFAFLCHSGDENVTKILISVGVCACVMQIH